MSFLQVPIATTARRRHLHALEVPAVNLASRASVYAIVDVSSIYGLKSSDNGHAPYSASKFGVVGLTKSAAIDYRQSGLRINAVAPGFTRSEIVNPAALGASERRNIPTAKHSGGLGEPEEIASAITWLCSDAARFLVPIGQSRRIGIPPIL